MTKFCLSRNIRKVPHRRSLYQENAGDDVGEAAIDDPMTSLAWWTRSWIECLNPALAHRIENDDTA
jgi:hypothetical protein